MTEATIETPFGAASDRGAVAAHLDGNNAGVLSSLVREQEDLKLAFYMAKKYPRKEGDAYVRALDSCKRPNFAESAKYAFPRGDSVITGPSVNLARELARCWGNIRYGIRIVSQDEDEIHIKGWATDCESNLYTEFEDRFRKLIQRRGKGWVKPDERDLRELVFRRGAILVRNALLQVLPPDLTEDCLRMCTETLVAKAAGNLKKDRKSTIKAMIAAFREIGVNQDMIEGYLGHGIDTVTEEEMAELTGIGKSIRDGQATVKEFFIPAGQGGDGVEVAQVDPERVAPKSDPQPKPNGTPEPRNRRPPKAETKPPDPPEKGPEPNDPIPLRKGQEIPAAPDEGGPPEDEAAEMVEVSDKVAAMLKDFETYGVDIDFLENWFQRDIEKFTAKDEELMTGYLSRLGKGVAVGDVFTR